MFIVRIILESLRDPVKFRALLIILLIVLLLGLDKTISTVQNLDSIVNPSHPNILMTAFQVTTEINNQCKEVMTEFQASRCYVFEFHNGNHNIAGVPWVRMTNTYETVAPGVSSEILQGQNMYVREIIRWVPSLVENKCIYQATKDTDPSLKSVLETQGIEQLYVCPIFFSNRKEPIGFVGLDYNTGWEPPPSWENVEVKLRKISFEIGKNLLNAKENKGG